MKEQEFVFSRQNYLLMALGVVVMALGYVLMQGGGSDDLTQFSPEIFSPRRITWAPMLVIAGLVIEVFAIMKGRAHG